ncbi:MAG: YfhO family protein [Candidatus Woesebacteria bacterium]|jgi:hypothetical protein
MKLLRQPYFKFALIFLILLGIRFYPIFFQNKSLFFGDNYALMVPGKIFTARWLRHGVLPLWNPTILAGISWIGDVNQSILYPSTLFFVFLEASTALTVTVISHLLISVLGMYYIVLQCIQNKKNTKQVNLVSNKQSISFLSACLWVFSTQLTNSINNISMLQSLAWLPWLVFLAFKIRKNLKNKFLFAIVVFLQFAGGYPQHVIYGILTAVLISSFYFFQPQLTAKKIKIWLNHWSITALFTLLLSAVIYLPFLETLLNSTRTLQTETQAVSGSLHPMELIKMLLPYFFESPHDGMRWGPMWNSMPNVTIYFTGFAFLMLLLSLLNKKLRDSEIKFFALFLFLTLILALGKYLPFFATLQQILPIFKITRGPSLILTVSTFVAITYLGLALTKIISKTKNSKTKFRFLTKINFLSKLPVFSKNAGRIFSFFLFLILIIFLSLSLLAKFNFNLVWDLANRMGNNFLINSAFHSFEKDQIILKVISQNVLFNCIFFLIAVLAWQRKRILLLTLILSLDMIYNTQGMLFFAPRDIYPSWQEIETANPIFSQTNNYRYLIRNYNYPYTDFGAYWEALLVRKPFSDSYIDEEELASYKNLKRFAKGMTPDWNIPFLLQSINGYTTLLPKDSHQLWNPDQETRINNLAEIKLDNPLLKKWAVKFYLVDDWFFVNEDLSSLAVIYEKDWWQVYELPALPRFRYEDDTAINFDQDHIENPNFISLKFNNDSSHSHLLIADRYDKNWRAWVNGQEVEIENFERMRKVKITAGKNQVVFKYQPKLFYLGAAISILSFLAVSLFICLTFFIFPVKIKRVAK